MAGDIQHLDLWLNAFIPASCPPWSETIAVEGLTVIYGLGAAIGPFWTDQRSFSAEITASSCLHSHVRLAFSPSPRIVDQWHSGRPIEVISPEGSQLPAMTDRASRTAIGLYNAQTINQNSAAAKIVRLIPRIGPASTAGATWYLHLDTWATPNDAPLAAIIGDIGCRGIVQLDLTQRRAEFHGQIGRFPAYELYLAINDGPATPIFRQSPPRDAATFHQPSTTPRPMRATVTF